MTVQIADLDAWISDVSGNLGNGSGPRMVVGYAPAFGHQRALISFPLSFAGAAGPIESALLKLRVKSGCSGNGGSIKFWVEEITNVFAENGTSGDCTTSVSGGSSTRWGVDSNPITSTRVKYEGSPGSNAEISINISAIIEAARLASKTRVYLRLIAADASTGYDEDASSRRCAFHTRETTTNGYEPKLDYTFSTNQAPLAPVNPNPSTASSGDTITTPGTSVTLTGDQTDLDEGDSIAAVQTQIYVGTATQAGVDAGSATKLQDKTTNGPFPSPPGAQPGGVSTRFVATHTGLTGNTKYAWRARTKDSAGAFGVWSQIQYFRTNTIPAAFSNVQVETDTTTPTVTGIFVDADPGAVIGAVWAQVMRDNPNGTVTAMLPRTRFTGGGISGGTSFALDIDSGVGLVFGTTYRLNVEPEDAYGGIGPLFSTWKSFTLVEQLGPSDLQPRTTAAKQNTRTPTLTIGHAVAFDQHELEVAPNPDGSGTLLWDKAPTANASGTSLPLAWAGSQTPSWGQTLYWRAKVRVTSTGNWTLWSSWFPFYINALPETPTLELVRDVGDPLTLSTLTPAVSPSVDPTLLLDFLDPDRDAYGEIAVRRHLQVRKASDDSLLIETVRRLEQLAPDYKTTVGRLLNFDSTTDWVAGTAATLTRDTAQKVTGDASLKLAIAALGASATSSNTGPAMFVGTDFTNLNHADVTTFLVRARCSSLTNLSSIRIRFNFNVLGTDFAEWTITPSAINTWEQKSLTKATPTATGGAVDWTKVKRIDVRVIAAGGGAYTGDVWIDDLIVDPLLTFAGERLDSFDSVPDSWVAGGGSVVTFDTSDKQEGLASFKIEATAAATGRLAYRDHTMDLSDYPAAVPIKIRAKASTLTDLTNLRIRFSSDNDALGNYAEYAMTPSGADAWEEFTIARNAPAATAGAVDWSDIRTLAVMITSAGYTGTIHVDDLRMGTLGELAKVRARYMDANTDSAWGPWTNGGDYGLLKLGVPPTVDFVGTAAPDPTNPRPNVAWRFASPKDQARRQVTINHVVGTDRQEAYNTTLQANEIEGIRIPAGVLIDGETYEAVIYTEDVDGLSGTVTTATWVAAFDVPDPLTLLTATFDPGTTVVTLDHDGTTLDDDHFAEYRYRRQNGNAPEEFIGSEPISGDTSFDDEGAWGFEVLRYSVTVYNGAYESEPITVEIVLGASGWALRVPGETTVPLYRVRPRVKRVITARLSAKQPLGRSTPVVHTGTTMAPTGSFTVSLPPSRFADIDAIQAAAERSRELPFIYLKDGLGRSAKVRLDTIPEDYGGVGDAELGVEYFTVA